MNDSKQQRRVRMDGHDRRELILDTAARLFAEYGYDQVTTKQLAKEASCSEGLLYSHFASKDEIYDALFQEYCKLAAETPVIELVNGSALESLRRYFNTVVFDTGVLSNEKSYRPFLVKAVQNRPSHSADVFKAVKQGKNVMQDAVVPMIELGQRQGEITASRDARDLAKLFWILMMGERTQWNFNPDSWPLYELKFEELESLFTKGSF